MQELNIEVKSSAMSEQVFFKHIYISHCKMIRSSLGLNKCTEFDYFNVTNLVAKNNSLATGTASDFFQPFVLICTDYFNMETHWL